MNEPRIKQFEETYLIGMRKLMTLEENTTSKLWRAFMPRLGEIDHIHGAGLYSVQIYPPGFRFQSRSVPFEKWAAVPAKVSVPPDGLETLIIPSGLYAVFTHHGPASTFHKTIAHIFGNWLPNSPYEMDQRPQFEIMAPDYLGPDHPDSEEEVWIPLKPKNQSL